MKSAMRPCAAQPADTGGHAAEAPASGAPSWGGRVRAYLALAQPRIIELLLITTIPVMFLAAGGLPPLVPVVATLVGGAFAAGSANALNCYIDRDIDAQMRRTRHRPLAAGTVRPGAALVFGAALGTAGTLLLGFAVNWLSAGLAAGAHLFYVLGYSLGLKRRTPANIVWGGAAGCVPVLVGWTAITGELAWVPVALFSVVFFWTPAHFWALALTYRSDYAAARVPMLPVVATEREVARRILAYAWLMVGCSLVLWPLAPTGLVYPIAAVVLGAAFLAQAYRLLGRIRAGATGPALKPMRLFHGSNTYLALLFVAVAIDPLVRVGV